MLAVAVKRANPPAPVLLQFSKLELPLPSSSASLGRMDVVVEVILCHLASFLEDGALPNPGLGQECGISAGLELSSSSSLFSMTSLGT